MKLCKYCITNVLESKVSWGYHSHSYDALTPSSKNRCLFCSKLRKDIRQVAPWLKESDYAELWPIYRWSIRSLAKIRESPETVVVTFRYVPPKKRPDRRVTGKEDEIDLPTRTFFLFPEKDLQPLPTVEQLGVSTNPAKNGGHQIRSWVSSCDQSHTDCIRQRKITPKAARFIPTRLLDISGLPGSPIRIIETATTSVQGPYCSLSHCWGLLKFTEVELHDNNRKKFMDEGVAWNLFTKNFQQAIEIARFLDVGYIWIDSLCIIQGSKPDWEREASRMHLVYRNSYCNIAIVDSADKNGGAFRDRIPENILPTSYHPDNDSPMFGSSKAWRVVSKDLWDSELLQSFLYARAWVFQERMLAPRILHYARNQVFWDCPSLSACEALPAGLPRPMDGAAGPDRHWRGRLQLEGTNDLAGPNDQPLSAYWQTAVRKYTSCNITQRSDKLIALWGIAKLIKDAMGVEYGEGLWEENLEDQLTWRVAECRLKERPVTEKRKIPSWSWASMDGEIITADKLSDRKHWTVCNHNGRPLELDLVGVKRYARRLQSRSDERAPGFLQHRVQSDSVLEIKGLSSKVKNNEPGHQDKNHIAEGNSPKEIDEDAEPMLHNISIPIQGHVSCGMLEFDQVKKAWLLRLHDGNNLDIEAYPDTIPGSREFQHHTKFAVLSAKKVVQPKSELTDSRVERQDDVEIEGRGILLKGVGEHREDHFQRTGSFRFRVANEQMFSLLLATVGWEKLSPTNYDAKRGRKFWLD